MGASCSGSSETRSHSRSKHQLLDDYDRGSFVSEKVDLELAKEKHEILSRVRLLLLSTSDSCRLTLLEWIRRQQPVEATDDSSDNIERMNAFVHSELMKVLTVLREDYFDDEAEDKKEEGAAAESVHSSDRKQVELEDDELVEAMDFLESLPSLSQSTEVAQCVTKLWSDWRVKEAFDSGGAEANQCLIPLLDDISRVCASDYLPSAFDLALLSTGDKKVKIYALEMDGCNVDFVDISALNTERVKWVHQFDNVTGILFVVDLNCYDHYCRHDEFANQMRWTLDLWEEVVNCRYFRQKVKALLFGNTKLFADKLKVKPLSIAFPLYPGEDSHSFERAYEFVERQFVEKHRHADQQIHTFSFHRGETADIEGMFEEILQIILSESLKRQSIV